MEIDPLSLLQKPLVELAQDGLCWVKQGELYVSDTEGDLIHDDIHTAFVLQFINHRWEQRQRR